MTSKKGNILTCSGYKYSGLDVPQPPVNVTFTDGEYNYKNEKVESNNLDAGKFTYAINGGEWAKA